MPSNSVPKSAVGAEFKDRVRTKLSSVLKKGYVSIGENVKSLTHFFLVAKTWKGEGSEKIVDEIRMVYDAAKLDLNDVVWDPWFSMPNVDCHLREVEAAMFIVDCDVEEMFLNFMLKPSLRPHVGVNLSSVVPEEMNGNLKG